MKWYRNLYAGDSVAGKIDRIKWKIKHNAGMISVYVIAFPSNQSNLLDIIPTRDLMQKAYPQKNMTIIGLAKGYREALELVRRIVDDTYQNTGTVDVKAYLEEMEGKSL